MLSAKVAIEACALADQYEMSAFHELAILIFKGHAASWTARTMKDVLAEETRVIRANEPANEGLEVPRAAVVANPNSIVDQCQQGSCYVLPIFLTASDHVYLASSGQSEQP